MPKLICSYIHFANYNLIIYIMAKDELQNGTYCNRVEIYGLFNYELIVIDRYFLNHLFDILIQSYQFFNILCNRVEKYDK